MARILLHPIFLELISSTALLDKLSNRKISKFADTKAEPNPVWLSEDDLCILWKVVLKSKLYLSHNGYRMENLAWRLWFYARCRSQNAPKPVSIGKPHVHFLSGSAEKDSSSGTGSILIVPGGRVTNYNSVAPTGKTFTGSSEKLVPSKSFVPMHNFSLFQDEDSSDSNDEHLTLDSSQEFIDYLKPDSRNGTTSRRPSKVQKKKKKDVDKYIQSQLFVHDSSKQGRSNVEFGDIAASVVPSAIRPSPEMKRIGLAPRRISKGFSIPSKKSMSSISTGSPKHMLSSISSDDALSSGLSEKEGIRLNPLIPNATYRPRRKSFSRSASPQISRTSVSMLTILMDGQLTMSENQDDSRRTYVVPPIRPSAPVPMYEPINAPIIEEADEYSQVPVNRKRSSGSKQGNHREISFCPSIW